MTRDSEKGKYTAPDGSRTMEYFVLMACSILSSSIGNILGWNSPSIVILLSENSPIPVTPSNISTLVATVAVGHMVGPLLSTYTVDKVGRKTSLYFCALPLVISWGLIMIATSIWELYIARFLAGLSIGLIVCVIPIYIGEVVSTQRRGAANSIGAVFYSIGILMPFIVAPHLSLPMMAGILLIIIISFVVCLWFLPESPYFLVMKNKMEEAEETLEKLRGKTDVSEELGVIVATLSKEEKVQVKRSSLKEIFTVRANLRAFLIIILFSVTHHFGGFYIILTYGQLIFKATNNTVSDYTLNVALGVIQVISSILTTCVVDRVGRKPLILWSGVIAAICNFMIGSYFYAIEYTSMEVSILSWAPFVASFLLVFSSNCGLVCPQIIMISEVFTAETKATSTCLVGIGSGLLATFSLKLYIWVAITLNYGHSPPFLAFAVVVAICTAVIINISPETKGKTFLEIQKELHE